MKKIIIAVLVTISIIGIFSEPATDDNFFAVLILSKMVGFSCVVFLSHLLKKWKMA